MTDSVNTITLDPDLVESMDHLRVRAYEKSALGPVLICSIVIHIVFLSLILFRPMTTAVKLTFGTYYTVDLVRGAELSGGSRDQSAFSEEMKDLLSDKRDIVLKKKSETIDLPPISRLDARKKSSREVDKAIEALRRKMAATPQGKRPPATTDGAGSAVAAQGSDVMNAYYGAIWSRIKAKWAFPGGILPKNDLIAVVHVRIMKNGAVEDISLEKRSANTFFNESAVKAVKKAAPFPPFPVGLGESSMEVGIRFHSSQLGTQ
ncbi:MAG TPA: energy transducer TonB [Syntrophales bacterium]|nr:energy transducer TonB [Syntrophales bacterium]